MSTSIVIVEDHRASLEAEEKAQIASRKVGSWSSPGVSKLGAERAKEDEAAAVAAGFSIAPPVYEIGSLVNQTGVDGFRASRQEFEEMATATDVCGKLSDLIFNEQREDKVIPLPALTMLDDGRVHNANNGTYPLTERGLDGLARFMMPGGGSYHRACPPELRAINFNHWLPQAQREDARATRKVMDEWENACNAAMKEGSDIILPPQPEPIIVDRQATLRTRMNHSSDQREVFAVVGPKYGEHDIDKICEQIMKSDIIPADARATVTYDGYKARIDVLLHTNVNPENAVAGEIFKAGLIFKTSDDGTGSIQVSAQIWRNLCLNLIIIDHAKELVMRRKHYGKNIEADVTKGIAEALGKISHFGAKWSEATMENVLDKYGCQDIDAVFRGLVFNKVVHVPNVRPEEMHSRLMRAWEMEPGYSKTSIINAVTRAAHENPWSKWADVEDMETVGGQLLYATVWNTDIPEDAGELSY